MTPDGKKFAYSVNRKFSDLYLVEGLKYPTRGHALVGLLPAVNLIVSEMPCSITDLRDHLPASLPRPCPEHAKTSREITNETLAARLLRSLARE